MDKMWTFFRNDLAMEIHIVLDRNGRLFFRTHLNENTAVGRGAIINNAICNDPGRQIGYFEDAYQALTRTIGRIAGPITLTGIGPGATYAQCIALRHGRTAFCFNSYGIGPGIRSTFDNVLLARNACNVYHFDIRGHISIARRIADFVDLAFTILLSFCTPGNFGHRFEVIPDENENAAAAIERAVTETARCQKMPNEQLDDDAELEMTDP
ncbi:MAG: hypothetical protein LBF24_02940 [Puniceicoccales bacterium]|jgi:hypothetical protein|nr:hypothetical protein [Puniceicoccales bacterium]